MKSAVRRLQSCLSVNGEPKLKHYFLPSINIMAGINNEQRMQILPKLERFLENPQAAVQKLITVGAVCMPESKVIKNRSLKLFCIAI